MKVSFMTALKQLALVLIATSFCGHAFAAGYEKNVFWSGRYGGVAGAGTAAATGGDAIYFNPAGIVMDKTGMQASLNLSPTTSEFKAPVITDGATMTSSRAYYLPFGLTYDWTPNDKWGVAIGAYAAAGASEKYSNLDFSGIDAAYTMHPTSSTDIAGYEIALGGGYKVTDKFKVGAAYRLGVVNASFNSVQIVPVAGPVSALNETAVENLKGTAQGFRLGAEYNEERWGAGVMYRSPLFFSTKGTSKTHTQLNTAGGGSSPATSGGDATVKTVFPTQASVGGYYDIAPKVWRTYLEYVWTQYSKDQSLIIEGNYNAGLGVGDIPDIKQNWRDQNQVRAAAEYMGFDWPIRFGYVWTSAVENPDFARPNFATPGPGNTLTVGTGHAFMDGRLNFDAALEYTLFTKDVGSVDPADAAAGNTGKYSTEVWAIHTGLAYNF